MLCFLSIFSPWKKRKMLKNAFSDLRTQKRPKTQNPKNLKIKFGKPKKIKQLHQKIDFLGHQVKIHSNFGNS